MGGDREVVVAWARADAAYDAYRNCTMNVFAHWRAWQDLCRLAESLGARPDAR